MTLIWNRGDTLRPHLLKWIINHFFGRFSAGQERQVRGTAAYGRHDGGRHTVANQAGCAGHDEWQGTDDQYAGAHAVRDTCAEETGVGRRQPQRHNVRGDQRAIAGWPRPARPFTEGPRHGLQPFTSRGNPPDAHAIGQWTIIINFRAIILFCFSYLSYYN